MQGKEIRNNKCKVITDKKINGKSMMPEKESVMVNFHGKFLFVDPSVPFQVNHAALGC